METHAELLAFLVEALEALEIPYALTGSIASTAYGEPRATRDIDIVAELKEEDVDGLRARFPAPEFYLDIETARDAIRSATDFNIIHPRSGYKIDVFIAHTSLDRYQIDEARSIQTQDVVARISPPEGVILNKLDYYRMGGSDKHLRDIASMLEISGDQFDLAFVAREAARIGVSDVWEALLRSVGRG